MNRGFQVYGIFVDGKDMDKLCVWKDFQGLQG